MQANYKNICSASPALGLTANIPLVKASHMTKHIISVVRKCTISMTVKEKRR